METENILQSKTSYTLQSIPIIVITILNNLSNAELLKCKYVCRLWKEIAGLILSKRIIIIKKEIPFEISKDIIGRPTLLRPFLTVKRNLQIISEYSQFYIEDRNILGKAMNLVPVHSTRRDKLLMIHYKETMHSYQPLPTRGMIETHFAIFPSHPDINIKRFFFSTSQLKPNSENRLSLTKMLKVSEEEIKCVLWFLNSPIKSRYAFPSLAIPSIVLSSLKDRYGRFNPRDHCGIAFIGKKINATILRIHNDKKLKTINFTNNAEIVNNPKFDQFNCVAFFFGVDRCRCENENLVLSAFKKSFPKVPVLFFSDIYVVELRTSAPDLKNAAEQQLHFVRYTRDVLILLLYIE